MERKITFFSPLPSRSSRLRGSTPPFFAVLPGLSIAQLADCRFVHRAKSHGAPRTYAQIGTHFPNIVNSCTILPCMVRSCLEGIAPRIAESFFLDMTAVMPGKGLIKDGHTEDAGGYPRVWAGGSVAARGCRADGGVCRAVAAASDPHGRPARDAAGAAWYPLRFITWTGNRPGDMLSRPVLFLPSWTRA